MRFNSTMSYDRRGPHLSGGSLGGFSMTQPLTVYNSAGVGFSAGNTLALSGGTPLKANVLYVVNSAGTPIAL